VLIGVSHAKTARTSALMALEFLLSRVSQQGAGMATGAQSDAIESDSGLSVCFGRIILSILALLRSDHVLSANLLAMAASATSIQDEASGRPF